jgi:hypothetical protein
MTIEQLIAQLKRHKNPDAKVLLTVGDEDKDYLSTSDFKVHCLDKEEYCELFVHGKKCKKQL